MTNHQWQRNRGSWCCSVCHWSWERRKRSPCPGVMRYAWGAWPAHLKTAGELHRSGLPIPDSPHGCYYQRLEPHWLWLYDARKIVHARPPLSPHPPLWFRANERCQRCGCEERERQGPPTVGGMCRACSFEREWTRQCNEIRTWAQASLQDNHTVLLDTETTGLGNTDTVIEIAVISAAQGATLLNTRIQNTRPIQEAAISRHHLTQSDLQSAPLFPAVWADLVAVLRQTQTVICYHADFHREKLTRTARHYGFALPLLEWQCLMNRYATFYGKVRKDDPVNPFQWQTLARACQQQDIPLGPSPRSLAQVQRARRLLQALAEKQGKQYE